MQPLGPNPLASLAPDAPIGGERASYGFASYVFDRRRDRLTKDGVAVALAPKPKALLRYFLDNPERVIEKRELIAAVWASTVVTDDSLVQLVLELRNALADREQQIVKTVPRRGYLFDARVRAANSAARCASRERAKATLGRPGRSSNPRLRTRGIESVGGPETATLQHR